MHVRLFLLAASLLVVGAARAADDYAVDPAHASVTFKASHIGLSWTHGRFKSVSGTFAVDADKPADTKFELSAKVDSIDTDNVKRDEHLRGPDFFNAKQYPTIAFKSTSAKPVKDGYEVTGDLTLHGVTKSVTLTLLGGRKAEFPKGTHRTGYTTSFTLKRSDYKMDKMVGPIGDEVRVEMSFEGVKK